MPERPPPREIVIGRSYRYRGHVIHLEEQIPDGVICFVLDDTAAAHFVPMKNDAPDAYLGQPAVEAAFAAILWPLDIVLLGMGEDGHTASLFPAAVELADGLTSTARTIAVTPPAAPHQRLSLTASAILAARHIFLQISGDAKKAVYAQALENGPVEQFPIRLALLQGETPVEVWISAR